MASPFVADWDDASQDLLAEYGEDFLVTSLIDASDEDRDVNAREPTGGRRGTFPVTLIFHEKGKTYRPAARGVAENAAQHRVGSEIMVQGWRETLPWEPRLGDRMLRYENSVEYRVSRFEPDDIGWMWFTVTAER